MGPLADLRKAYADIAALEAAMNLMGWDQQVLMPSGGAEARANHLRILKRRAHELLTSDEMRRKIEEAEKEAHEPDDAAMVSAIKRDLEVAEKLPLELVERKARVTAEAYEAWKEAKPANDFATVAPYYREVFAIARETSETLGYSDHPYDPLIGLYEYGATHADAVRMFDSIREPIVDLVREIRDRGRSIDDRDLASGHDPEALRSFAVEAASAIGFDFNRGRLNLSRNAFCAHLASTDIRMTTRPSEHIKGVVSSSLHEMGHGLYEQGIPVEWDGTPLAGGVSLAVHESQSRLWENIVGRSLPFWQHFLPVLQRHVPALSGVAVDEFWRMLNKVQPEFIRVGADELTYNLHILVRFELEVDLVTGNLDVNDLPEAWNARYEKYLGITPETDTVGCLQDVHWSKGSVGYFPTYAMGNLIGGQMWACMKEDLGDLDSYMEKGEFAPILGWLQERVYQQGRRFTPKELVQRVVGSEMDAAPWLEYAKAKYRCVYDL